MPKQLPCLVSPLSRVTHQLRVYLLKKCSLIKNKIERLQAGSSCELYIPFTDSAHLRRGYGLNLQLVV